MNKSPQRTLPGSSDRSQALAGEKPEADEPTRKRMLLEEQVRRPPPHERLKKPQAKKAAPKTRKTTEDCSEALTGRCPQGLRVTAEIPKRSETRCA